MSLLTIDFVDRIVKRFPHLRGMYEEHISDHFGEVLPHLFVGDLANHAVDLFLASAPEDVQGAQARRDLEQLLEFLETAYEEGGEEIEELISVSFLEHLPRPGIDPGAGIRSLCGPRMQEQLRVIG